MRNDTPIMNVDGYRPEPITQDFEDQQREQNPNLVHVARTLLADE